jgi:hypothetical protein
LCRDLSLWWVQTQLLPVHIPHFASLTLKPEP